MKKLYSFLALASICCSAWAADVTDVISATTMEIAETYTEQEVSFNSSAVYLVTLKDDGNGPQFKAGSSGIVTKASGGTVKRVEVAWGSKSNEDIVVYGKNTPYGASNTVIDGTELGIIEFTVGSTVGIDIEGDWEYIGITTTNKKGKAAQFGSISITWSTPDETPDETCDGVIINEVCGDDGTTYGNEDWIELYNPTNRTLDLSGVKVIKTDEDGLSETLCTIADGTTLAAGSYLVVEKGTNFTAGLSNNKNLTISIMSPLDKRLSMFDKVSAFTHNGSHPAGGSYSFDDTDNTWCITPISTKGEANQCHPIIETVIEKWFVPVTAETLVDGLKVIALNREYGYVMSYDWNTTKGGSVYLNAYDIIEDVDGDKVKLDMYMTRAAQITLVDGGDGTWALKFVDTNNYLNDDRFMACTEFKNIDFKKKDDPAKGTRATITFNNDGDAEINYGDGGVIKFNYKDDGTSRFFNYDPADKPEEHQSVYLYTVDNSDSISLINSDNTASATVYYNMQGVRVANPSNGIFIKVVGNNAKVVKL